jgi:DNA polymerase V
MYALVDCNNFYASCERVFRPELIGEPIVVLSNNDGAVIARSNEAKDLGIPMGAVAFQYEHVFRENNVEVFSANFALYGDMSHRVMSILQGFAPEMEIYSIDEAFLLFEGCEKFDLKLLGEKMVSQVRQWTGIPISVGFAPSKALAKVANRIAKKYPVQTNSCHILQSEESRLKALKWLKAEDIWGVGRQHAKRLWHLGVKTAFDFTQLSDAWVRRNMSVLGVRLKHDLLGIPTIQMEEINPKKSITTSRSFERNLVEFEEVKERVVTFMVMCAEKLRKQNSCCNSFYLFLKTNTHRQDLEQYRGATLVNLPYPSNSTLELVHFATEALKTIFRKGFRYKKAGVIIMDFIPEDKVQLTLFENSNPRHHELMKTLDEVNIKFGQQKIKLASQDQRRVWKMKQQKKSPSYTTLIQDVIRIKTT